MSLLKIRALADRIGKKIELETMFKIKLAGMEIKNGRMDLGIKSRIAGPMEFQKFGLGYRRIPPNGKRR